MTLRRLSVLVLALTLIPAAWAEAQTTGRIVGTVEDTQGAAVPGVTVTVSSPALQGIQTQTTDQTGNFRFVALPVGTYMVKAALTGFKTIEQPNVMVRLDQTVTLTFKLEVATRTETVTVTASTPTIDTTSTTAGIVVGPEFFQRLAGARDFYGVTRFAPGTTTDAVGPAFYGSSGAENQYIIEGLNTTGVELGSKGKTLNQDFIQEVEVKSGGLTAEYGRVTGGIVNVVTKSGSNVFRGSIFGFAEGGGLFADDNTRDKRPVTTTTVTNLSGQWDTGAQLGGYFVKDRAWFYGTINRDSASVETTVIRALDAPGSPALDSVIPTDASSNLWATKFTFSPGQGHSLNLSAFGDPTTTDGAIFGIAGPESTWKGERKTGGTDVILRYDGTLASKLAFQGIYARHKEKEENFGPGRTIAQQLDLTVNPNAITGGFGFFQDQEFTRDVLKGDATYFFGNHEIKGGADWEHLQAVNQNFNGGAGQRIYKLPCTGVFPAPCRAGSIPIAQGFYYRHRFYVDDLAPGYDRDDPSTWTFAVPLVSEPESHNISFFAQDSWRAGGGLTINAGIRWEYQDVRARVDAEGKNPTAFSLKDNWAPRLGFVWDVTQDGRSKLYASYGRFYESIPMDINIRAFGGEVQCFCYNTSADPAQWQPNSAVRATSLLGGEEPVDPNLKGQYLDEFLVGYEREVAKDFVVGAKFTYRDLGRVIEDFLIIDEGSYFIANPGEGIGSKMTFYDYSTVDAPKAKRTSTAFEVTARKRFSDNWQFLASAVFSKLEGNYDGTFQVSTGQLDPNINSAFDYADFLVNADGRLSNDRNVQVKLDGSYEFSTGAMKGLNLGASFHWLAGTPLNAYGYSFLYQNWEYYLAPRGSLGRGPADWEADFHASYPVRLGSRARLNLIADIFNIFNRQSTTLLDERFNLPSHGDCAGISDCNGDNGWATQPGTLTPLGSLSDPRNNAPNPDYLKKGLRFTAPFSLRLGARITF